MNTKEIRRQQEREVERANWRLIIGFVVVVTIVGLLTGQIQGSIKRSIEERQRIKENHEFWRNNDPEEVLIQQFNEEVLPALPDAAEEYVENAYNPDTTQVEEIIGNLSEEIEKADGE